MTMQIHICHKGGGDVSLDDCAGFSKPMADAIEASEILNEPYVLEISSPGISDLLTNDRDFETFRGFPVEVIFRNSEKSELRQAGLLHQRSNDHVQINIKGRIKMIPREDVVDVRLTSPTG